MELLTINQACEKLHVSRRTLYRMIVEKVLPQPKRLRNFRHVYFVREDFERACLQQMR